MGSVQGSKVRAAVVAVQGRGARVAMGAVWGQAMSVQVQHTAP